MTIKTLVTLNEVKLIQASWKELLEKSKCNRAFSSPEWYLGCCLCNKNNPMTFVLSCNGKIRAILPLVNTEKTEVLTFTSILADYNDLITEVNDLQSATRLLTVVLEENYQYTRLVLENIRVDSNLYRAILLLDKKGIKIRYKQTETCLIVNTNQNYSKYLSERSSAFRKDIKRKRKRAHDAGFLIEEVQPRKSEIPRLIDRFMELHKSRIQNSVLSEGNNECILKNVFSDLILNGAFRVFLVRRGNEIHAIQLSAQGVKSLGYWNGGFNQEIDVISPGKLLFELQIIRCIEQGVGEFDLLRGNEAYKKSWATATRPLVTIMIDPI
ncbi:MAG: hypothetical protein DRR16_10985 [Candidatus Parabeggiatoa sp. nov. 3]|nr:MAG: hypothetical protein DRR00_16270 [Gammaproteobacteria bacterium]RKZ57403.1 MAG: hypothetical protein DRQ99_26990 [Gammaproteobacteria bacterium]RKZ85922.1 MAG: hypothetical protein DRR16_10985 [Gammaproteobacteria bacterium]